MDRSVYILEVLELEGNLLSRCVFDWIAPHFARAKEDWLDLIFQLNWTRIWSGSRLPINLVSKELEIIDYRPWIPVPFILECSLTFESMFFSRVLLWFCFSNIGKNGDLIQFSNRGNLSWFRMEGKVLQSIPSRKVLTIDSVFTCPGHFIYYPHTFHQD